MGIWNIGASSIGYAYQSAKGSGINVKLDPRIYQTDNGDYTRQSRSSNSSENGFKNKDVLDGTNEQLYDLTNQLDNEIHKLEVDFNRNIISETNADKSLQMQKDYASKMNILSSRKQSLYVTNQNAKFEYDKYQTARSEISKNDIGSEIALANPLAGTITRGDDLLGMIASGKNPYQIVLEKDKKTGKYYGDVLTNNKYLDYYNQHSGLTEDESGRIVPTIFNAPVTKMNNFMVTKKEIEEKIDKTVANNIVNSIDKEVNGGQAKYHLKTNSNISSINTGINTAWESLSEGSRSYMLSNVINGDIHIDDGTKEGKWMSGKSAVLEVEKNMIDMRSDKTTKEEKEKLLNQSKKITDAIVNTAKINVHNIAAGRAYGQYNFSKDESLMPNRNAAGDGSTGGQDKTSPLNALYAKAVNVPGETTLKVTNYNGTGYEDIVYPQKRIAMNIQDKTFITNTMFGITPSEIEKSPVNANMLSKVIIGNIPFNFKSIINGKNGAESKIIGISDEIKYFPATADIPSINDKNFFGTTAKDENGNYILQGYIGVTVEVDEETHIPIPTEGAQGGYKMIRAGDVGNNPSKYPSLNATFIDNWGWNDKVRYTVYTPAPDAFAATTNTASEGSQAQYDFNYSNSRQVENGYTKTLNEEILNRNNDARTYMLNNPMKDRSGNIVEPTNDNIIQIDNTIIIGQDGKNKFKDAIAKKKLVVPTSKYEYLQNMERIKSIPTEAITEKSRAELQEENDAAFKKEQTKGTVPYKNSYVPY